MGFSPEPADLESSRLTSRPLLYARLCSNTISKDLLLNKIASNVVKLHYVQILKLCISKEQYKMLKSMFFFKYKLLELFISSYNALNEYDKKFVTF